MDANLLRQYLTGTVNGMSMNKDFLLVAAILMEIPMIMILLSRILKYKANRSANILAAVIMTFVQSATLFAGKPAGYYLFCSCVEIATTAGILWIAIKWTRPVSPMES
jgi:hypothetical protein